MPKGAHIQPIAMYVNTFVKITSIIRLANFVGCMLISLVSAKAEYRLLPYEADMALATLPCSTALACD